MLMAVLRVPWPYREMVFLLFLNLFLAGLYLSDTAVASPMAEALSSILRNPCTVVFLDLPPLLIKVQEQFCPVDHFLNYFCCAQSFPGHSWQLWCQRGSIGLLLRARLSQTKYLQTLALEPAGGQTPALPHRRRVGRKRELDQKLTKTPKIDSHSIFASVQGGGSSGGAA